MLDVLFIFSKLIVRLMSCALIFVTEHGHENVFYTQSDL